MSFGEAPRTLHLPLVLLCFLLSGFAALLYETAWTQQFSFVFGTSELAVVSVLAAYMAGLAAGSALGGRLAPRVRHPILVYGLLELGIAASALAVPLGIRISTGLYLWLFGASAGLPEAGVAAALFQLACAFAVLLPGTALMGATLPLLARYAVRRDDEIGSRVGALYAVNTAGAIAGTLVTAFVLLPALGLQRTVALGAAVNALVFVAAALLAWRSLPAPAAPSVPRRAAGARWILPLVAVAGVASFTYEVLWTRLLAHLLGGSLYAFATMLAAFLFGIAAGSAVAARLAKTPERAALGFALAQLGAAAFSLAAYSGVDWLPLLAEQVGAGRTAGLAPNALVAGAVLVPSTLCIGAAFPFAVRLLARHEHEAASASARVYAWNTLGAIVGAVAAGFVLLPGLGFRGTIAAAAAANLALALATALWARPRRRVIAGLALGGGCALVLFPPSNPWGVLRAGLAGESVIAPAVRYYAVGRSSTVLLRDLGDGWKLTTNGLQEADIQRPGRLPGRSVTADWLLLLPVLARPEARTLLLVGLGGGVALEAASPALQTIDVVELEPEVVNANRSIASERAIDPLSDPRTHIHLNDARSALLLTAERYDAIVSQPSHPWTAGASHLYTREFFALVRERLTPGGVFVQWIGLRYVDESLLRSLLATLAEVFSEVRVYQPDAAALLFLASDAPLEVEQSAARALAAAPAHFARHGLRVPGDIAALLSLDTAGAHAAAAGAFPTRDAHNLLAVRSPRLQRRDSLVGTPRPVLPAHDALPAAAATLDLSYLVRRVAELGDLDRARTLSQALPTTGQREMALGWVELARGRPAAAIRHFDAAGSEDGRHAEVEVGRLLARRRLEGAERAARAALEMLDAPAVAVPHGWLAAEREDWEGLAALESELAALRPRHPLFAEASRLRVRWRAQLGTPALAREGIVLVDALLAVRQDPVDLLLRARVASRAEEPTYAMAALEAIARLAMQPAQRGFAREALEIVEALPADKAVSALHAKLRRLQ